MRLVTLILICLVAELIALHAWRRLAKAIRASETVEGMPLGRRLRRAGYLAVDSFDFASVSAGAVLAPLYNVVSPEGAVLLPAPLLFGSVAALAVGIYCRLVFSMHVAMQVDVYKSATAEEYIWGILAADPPLSDLPSNQRRAVVIVVVTALVETVLLAYMFLDSSLIFIGIIIVSAGPPLAYAKVLFHQSARAEAVRRHA